MPRTGRPSCQAVIGYALARDGLAPRIFAADKVWTSSGSAGRSQLEESRRHWGVTRFDLAQVHNLLNWDAHLPLLKSMKASGQVRYIGITTSEGRRHDAIGTGDATIAPTPVSPARRAPTGSRARRWLLRRCMSRVSPATYAPGTGTGDDARVVKYLSSQANLPRTHRHRSSPGPHPEDDPKKTPRQNRGVCFMHQPARAYFTAAW